MIPNSKKIVTKIKTSFWRYWQSIFITAPSLATLMILANSLGIFQVLEWAVYDQYFRFRPQEPIDNRVVVVTIDEVDLHTINSWPLSDQVIAETIKIIKKEKPRTIGLDLYRDLVIEPGHKQLVEVFESTPNLIGVEKVSGRKVKPSPILQKQEQVALADLIVDPDSKIRRALLSIRRENEEIQLGLGTKVALEYLAVEGINLEPVKEEKSSVLRLGKATFFPLQKNDGAYINADNGGYQILLNYRGVKDSFTTISITDVLARRIPSDLMVDKIVLIGSTAESLNDAFYTPYSSVLNNHPIRSGGVIVHANIASQIVSAAIDGRPLIKTIPEALEWVWILNWAFIGALVSWKLIKNQHHDRDISAFASLLIISMLVPGGILVLSSYLFFVNGWWIPVVAPLLALSLSALCIPSYQNFEWRRIASVDHLTHIPNRSFFDAYLAEQWVIHLDKQQPLSVVLCDVDYFKLYNDNYGHQAGDECLKKVAWAIATAVRKTDMAARYGGEEFVIILPNTHTAMAIQVSERVCGQVRGLRLAHDKSTISNYVTLSCGSATTIPDQDDCLEDLLKKADLALYKAKEQGRNQVVNH